MCVCVYIYIYICVYIYVYVLHHVSHQAITKMLNSIILLKNVISIQSRKSRIKTKNLKLIFNILSLNCIVGVSMIIPPFLTKKILRKK